MSRRAALVLAGAALVLAGCAQAVRPGQPISGRTLTIYFAGPLRGASSPAALAALGGARLALTATHGEVGKYRIVLRWLDDSTAASGGWDPNQTTLNARRVVQDPTAVGYLGDFNSGASAISIPLLNRAGTPQISPGSTAVGLTTDGPGAAPGEPQKYYPTGVQTFARVVPTDASQAVALVQIQRRLGCHSVFVLHDGEVDGEDTALTFVLTAQSAGLRVLAVQAFARQASSYASVAASVAGSNADCVLISAIDERSALRLTEQVAAATPSAKIFAANELADSAYTAHIPRSLDPRVIVVSATLAASDYPPAVRGFLAEYTREVGPPEPPAIFGYAAMRVMLGAIAAATHDGREQADRARVLAALFSTGRRRSVLGSFGIDRAGDPTIGRYGIYRLVAGRMRFVDAAG